jgi:tRNA1Val (adenine37-N6)-methyltransferase
MAEAKKAVPTWLGQPFIIGNQRARYIHFHIGTLDIYHSIFPCILPSHFTFVILYLSFLSMSNSYFRFKQFTIQQDQCAMKVCTDACLFGAWLTAKAPHQGHILDIGSGTGLLMMMLAQRSQAKIHGIEIDLGAYKQSKENTGQNDWKDRLTVFPGDVRHYALPVSYDFIFANPPFFENDLASASGPEQVAKHSKLLTLDELLIAVHNNLQPQGSFAILLPYNRWEYFDKLAHWQHFHLADKVLVKQSPKHNYFRALLHYSRQQPATVQASEITIQKYDGAYTEAFTELLRDYYLYL